MACTPKSPDISENYRSAGDPIYSSATLDPTRLLGDWQQVGAFGAPDCSNGGASFGGAPGALTLRYALCLSGETVQAEGALPGTGPGRFAAPGLPGDLWLLWVDTDARTLVFGTPSGAYGFVLNRGGNLPADRVAAVREILDWNGYDLEKLHFW